MGKIAPALPTKYLRVWLQLQSSKIAWVAATLP